MECTGKLHSISRNIDTGGLLVTLETSGAALQDARKLKDLPQLTIRITRYRAKRSLDANAYYWKLIAKLSEALKISKPRAHNLILRRYGQREELDGRPVLITVPDTEEAEKSALEAETYHIRPTSQTKTGRDGVTYRTYVLLRGSSTYNTREMSLLIEGLVSECKDSDIETLPPEELERIMKSYEEKGNCNGIH